MNSWIGMYVCMYAWVILETSYKYVIMTFANHVKFHVINRSILVLNVQAHGKHSLTHFLSLYHQSQKLQNMKNIFGSLFRLCHPS